MGNVAVSVGEERKIKALFSIKMTANSQKHKRHMFFSKILVSILLSQSLTQGAILSHMRHHFSGQNLVPLMVGHTLNGSISTQISTTTTRTTKIKSTYSCMIKEYAMSDQ